MKTLTIINSPNRSGRSTRAKSICSGSKTFHLQPGFSKDTFPLHGLTSDFKFILADEINKLDMQFLINVFYRGKILISSPGIKAEWIECPNIVIVKQN